MFSQSMTLKGGEEIARLNHGVQDKKKKPGPQFEERGFVYRGTRRGCLLQFCLFEKRKLKKISKN